MIINLLQVEKLGHREAESLAQGHTADKWQSQDLNPSLLVAELQLWGTYNHLHDVEASSSYTGRQVQGDLKALPRPVIKNHSNNDASRGRAWPHLQTRPREVKPRAQACTANSGHTQAAP